MTTQTIYIYRFRACDGHDGLEASTTKAHAASCEADCYAGKVRVSMPDMYAGSMQERNDYARTKALKIFRARLDRGVSP